MKSTVQAIVTLIVAIALTFAAVVWADSAAARGATSSGMGSPAVMAHPTPQPAPVGPWHRSV